MALITLVGLALLDSLSTGTLVIPLIFLAQPKVQLRSLTLYCFTLALFYFVLGSLILLGIETSTWNHTFDTSSGRYWIQLTLGIILFGYGIFGSDPDSHVSESKWRARLEKITRPRLAIFIALLAGILEAATMLPYLAALGMLNTWESSLYLKIIIVMGYCGIMFVPALALMMLRCFAASWIVPRLDVLVSHATRNADSAVLWVAAIIGFLMAAHAINEIL